MITPSATQAPASKVSTSPSTTTPASPSLVCSRTNGHKSVLDALQQAVCFYSAQGIKIQQVLTDRGSIYRSKLFTAACHQLGLQHLFTKPYRPQTNGKAERFIQTDQLGCDSYQLAATIKTASGARTGLFVAELSSLFVAVPHRGAQTAEIRRYTVQ